MQHLDKPVAAGPGCPSAADMTKPANLLLSVWPCYKQVVVLGNLHHWHHRWTATASPLKTVANLSHPHAVRRQRPKHTSLKLPRAGPAHTWQGRGAVSGHAQKQPALLNSGPQRLRWEVLQSLPSNRMRNTVRYLTNLDLYFMHLHLEFYYILFPPRDDHLPH